MSQFTRACSFVVYWCALFIAATGTYQRDPVRLLTAIFLILLVSHWSEDE